MEELIAIPSPAAVHTNAIVHGWYDGVKDLPNAGEDFIPSKLALIHSEVSEALEAYRKHGIFNLEGPPGQGRMAEELADIVIRVLDLAGFMKIDIDSAIAMKHEYNKTRPYRHGNKVV